MIRREITLTPEEKWKMKRLPEVQGEAFRFWASIAESRGLDYKTIQMGANNGISGLPVGHGQHWCYPTPLKCKHKPVL